MLASAIRMSRWTKSLHDASFAGPICRPLQAQPFLLISGLTLGNQTQTVSSGSANTQMAYSTTVKQPLKFPDGFSATVADVHGISLRVFFRFRLGSGRMAVGVLTSASICRVGRKAYRMLHSPVRSVDLFKRCLSLLNSRFSLCGGDLTLTFWYRSVIFQSAPTVGSVAL